MLRAVQEINDFSGKARFPNRAGSFRTDLKNPALEVVKAVCRVVSLDGTVSDERCGGQVRRCAMGIIASSVLASL